MPDYLKFYIDGAWVDPAEPRKLDVINPATEEPVASISIGSAADVDRAAVAARRAFGVFSQSSIESRVALLGRIVEEYEKRKEEMAKAITSEMGAPSWLSSQYQVALGLAHIKTAHAMLQNFAFEELRGTTMIVKEPIGVCGLITPWNWPINQITCKVAPALAVGCTMVLKPSEVAPLSAMIFAEICDAAGVPAGVFNLVNGDGPGVGTAIAGHPEIDMVSFTGSTRAGIQVAQTAAQTVKRVAQELGGKSPNILLDDANFEEAVAGGIVRMMLNSGQSCNAPTRMLVPASRLDEVKAIAKKTAESLTVGNPEEEVRLGPVVSEVQWNRIQQLIEKGVEEGATVVAGGPGRPDGLKRGYFVKPTIFADVTPDMTVVREEIFGPVLVIQAYVDEADAIALANDTPYGLAAYIQSGDPARANRVARQLRAGQVTLNAAGLDFTAPFGGYKQSGNGREWGDHGFAEYLETKAMLGHG
ncbi:MULTISPECIES: aldehyde dehydrogenase family protein [Sphingobium]|uniref:aldehyde dehydrogenase family protein n=1 Tax=Sphingobium TaxID=165695 RepID=UPI00159C7108|nr:aldehyde dehydrogenase family protein [Sphingobium sp. 15-1]